MAGCPQKAAGTGEPEGDGSCCRMQGRGSQAEPRGGHCKPWLWSFRVGPLATTLLCPPFIAVLHSCLLFLPPFVQCHCSVRRQLALRVYIPSLLRPDCGRLDDVKTVKVLRTLTDALDAFCSVRWLRAAEDQESNLEVYRQCVLFSCW